MSFATRSSPGHYRPDIDGLRAIAVMAVVAFHAFPSLLPGGFVGVDLFFVISGYLISRIVVDGLGGRGTEGPGLRRFLAGFYARRVRRIFPALLLVMAVCLVAGWFMLMADDYQRLGKHTVGGVLFVSNLVLHNEAGYFDAAGDNKPLLHLWSLGIEEQFYIFFPLIVAAIYRFRSGRAHALLLALVAILLASFALNVHMSSSAPVGAFFYPQTRVWELLAGSVLAQLLLVKAAPGVRVSAACSIVGAVLVAAGFALIGPEDRFPGWWALLPTAGAVLLIGAGMDGPINRLLATAPLRSIGLISYPLYLWHWALLSLLYMSQQEPPSTDQRVFAIAASVMAAWLTWRLLERKVQARREPRVVGGLAAGAVALGVAGAAVSLMHGLPGRFPNVLQGLVAADYPYKAAYRDHRCLLAATQGPADFASECEAPPGTAPLLFLWGDSHAAHWYPGLETLVDDAGRPAYRVAQYTASGCPPLVGTPLPNRKQCSAINDAALDHLSKARPDVVVLSANWAMYDGHSPWSRDDPTRLKKSIDAVRAMGVKRIVLIGPVPQWDGGLPKLLLMASRRDDWSPPPERLEYGVDPASALIDAQLRRFASEWGVAYVSPRADLCNAQGCLTRVGHSLTAWDYGHLTTEASAFVLKHYVFFRVWSLASNRDPNLENP